jgi:hypothetical protein
MHLALADNTLQHHVAHPSARRSRRSGQTAPLRAHPTGHGPHTANHLLLPSSSPGAPRLHTYDAPPPRTRDFASLRLISGDPAALGEPPSALLRLSRRPYGRRAPPRDLPRAPLSQTLTLAPGAGPFRCVLCHIGLSIRPSSGFLRRVDSQLRW